MRTENDPRSVTRYFEHKHRARDAFLQYRAADRPEDATRYWREYLAESDAAHALLRMAAA